MRRETNRKSELCRILCVVLLAGLVAAGLSDCGTAGGSPSSAQPPSQASVTVSVSPSTASLYFGQQQQFSATVSGTTNTAVNWLVNGIAGGNSSVGTITTQGQYTAPDVLPSSPTIAITATSQADSSASGTATVTLESDVQVAISPTSASVPTSTTEQFTAQVTGTGSPSSNVNWSLTGSGCSAGNCGTLQTSGNTATYTAPATVPSAPQVQIVATSVADPSKSASATVTITQSCSQPVSISPATASLALGAQQSFTAQVCFSTNQNVTWSVTGSGCSAGNCGTVASTGASTATYTAPPSLPPSNPVTLVAASVADTTKTASAAITITANCSPAISVSPSAATVALSQQESFTASVCFTTNQSVTWSVTGSGCSGTDCGTVSSTGASTATYTAPASLPPSNPVTLVATSMADTSQSGTATISVVSGVSVTLNTISAEAAVNRRVSLAASVQETTNQAVTWAVDGVANGNGALGEICVAGSNPCAPPSGATTAAVDFLAPATVPSPAGVYVTATAAADTSASATAEVTILPHLVLGISPVNSVIAPSGTVEFAATVNGSENSTVTWQAACSGSACGAISTSGVYTAPAAAPSPNAITITAISQDDPTQTATVALTSAVALSGLSPASATAGAANGFTLAVTGYNFAPTSPGPGTTLALNGTAQPTTCASSTACTITISPTDVGSAGTLEIQAQNPDGTLSNSLPFVVVPADGPMAVVPLSASEPVAGAEDITAVQPTTDGTGAGPMTVIFLGLFDTSTNTCNVSESPIELVLPSSGSASYAICLGGEGLDPSFTYQVAGSQSSDVTVSGPQWFDGSLVELTVTVASTAVPGPRTLVITDPNSDRAAASGAIDLE